MSDEEQPESDTEAVDEPAAPMLRSLEEANRLVTENLGLAHKFAYQHQWTKIDPDELQSLAMLGLVKAGREFDPTRAQFSTFAWLKMKSEVRTHHKATQAMSRGGGTVATHQIGVDEDGKSYDIPDEHDADEGLVDAAESVGVAMKSLSGTEREVVRSRYFDGKTLEQIGVERGVSKERIRQIEVKALRQCRRELSPPPCAILPAASDPIPELAPPPRNRRAVVDAKAGKTYPTVSAAAAGVGLDVAKVCQLIKRGKEDVDGRRFRYATPKEAAAVDAQNYAPPPAATPVRFDGATQFRQLRCKQLDGMFSVAEAAATAKVSKPTIYLSLQSGKPVGVSRLNFWRDEGAMRAEPTNGVPPARSGRPPMLLKSEHRDKPVTVSEAAELAGVSEFTVHSAVRRGRPTGPNKMRFERAGPAAREPTTPAPPPAAPVTMKIDGVIDRYERMLAAAKTIKAALAEFPELAEMLGLAATLSDEERERRRAG